jgi:parallel beta-helix repeat protein
MVWNVWIQNCEFEACRDGLLINATTGVHFVHVIDNYIFGDNGNGIEIRYSSVKAVNIEDNVIWGNRGQGILLYGAEYINIVGNQIFDNSYGSTSTHDGIYIGEYSGQNSCFITIVGNTINNEAFTRTQRYGINIENSTENLTIVGNDLKGNNAGGMYISAWAAKNSVIANNLGYP